MNAKLLFSFFFMIGISDGFQIIPSASRSQIFGMEPKTQSYQHNRLPAFLPLNVASTPPGDKDMTEEEIEEKEEEYDDYDSDEDALDEL